MDEERECFAQNELLGKLNAHFFFEYVNFYYAKTSFAFVDFTQDVFSYDTLPSQSVSWFC